MQRPEAFESQRGAELERAQLTNIGQVIGAGVVGFAAGVEATAQLTKNHPVSVSLSPDFDAEASFTRSPGLRITNHGRMLYYQEVDADSHIPALNGVKINVTTPDIYDVAQDAVAHPHSQSKLENQLIAIVSQRDGTKEKVADSLTSAVVDGGTALGLVAAATVAGIKIWQPGKKLKTAFENIKNPLRRKAVRIGAVALAASSVVVGSYETGIIATQHEDMGRPLPSELASKTPFLSDPRIGGDSLFQEVERAKRVINRGLREWNHTNDGVNTAVSRYELNHPKLGSRTNRQTVFAATGILCNSGFDQTVYQSIQWRIPHDVTGLGGDNFMTGNRWSFENNCMKTIQDHTVGKNNLSALQNHDGEPTAWDISKKDNYARRVDGTYFVSVPDPRDMMGDKDAKPPSGKKLKFAIARAGSIAANRACEIKQETGHKPQMIVGAPEIGDEAILRNCVESVTSDHYLFSKSPKRPILRNIKIGDDVVHQFVLTSASGSKTNFEPYKSPQKLAGVGLQNYSRTTGELVSAQAIVYGPGLKPKVIDQDTTTTTRPNQSMINFVKDYSPSADKLEIQPNR